MITKEEQFANWLSINAPSKRLSDCFIAMTEVESFSKKKRIISCSIYDVTDSSVTAKIVNLISSDRIYRFTHKKQMRIIVEAAQLYHRYTKETQTKPEPAPERQSHDAVDIPDGNDQEVQQPEKTNVSSEGDCTPAPVTPNISEKIEDSPSSTHCEIAGTFCVDFTKDINLAFTKPVSFSYFGDVYPASSWRKLYVKACEVLFDDYPTVFAEIRKDASSGDRKFLVFNEETAKRLTTPACIGEGYYVELNRSASDLVYNLKQLLDKCAVDYDNVTVVYCKSPASPAVEPLEIAPDHIESHSSIAPEELGEQKIATEPTVQENRVSAEPALESGASSEVDSLLSSDEYAPLRKELARQRITTEKDLRALKLWAFMNQYNLYSIGMRQKIFTKVIALLNPVKELDSSEAYILNVGKRSYSGATPADAFLQFCNDMLSRYPLQFRLLIGLRMTKSAAIPIRKGNEGDNLLKLSSLAAFVQKDLTKDEVVSYAKWIQARCGENSEIITISEPKTASVSQQENKPDESCPPDDSTSKAAAEASTQKEESSSQVSPEFISRIEQFVLEADLSGTTYDDVKNLMDTTMVAVKRGIAASMTIVDIKGRLYHEDAFIDWEDGADQLETIVEKLMQKNHGYISAAQLYDFAKVEMNMFLTDNDVNDERSVYDIAAHLFGKENYHGRRFVFYGKMHISYESHPITCNLDIFRNYAADQGGVFSMASLVEYLGSIGVNTGNLGLQMKIADEPIFFYYEPGILMCADSMNINDAWIATVKDELTALFSDVGNYMILRMIPEAWLERLPTLPGRRPWTPLLLQSILRCYSKELGAKTIRTMTIQSFDTLHAMLVTNDGQIQTFGDVVISCLVDNEMTQRSFDAEELRLILVDAGAIQGGELIGNMSKVLSNDERFAWNASGDRVTVEV